MRLEADGYLTQECEAILQSDERKRAIQFKLDHLRRRFILCRSALRSLLGRYLQIPAPDVAFIYSPKGKPALTGTTNLHFNVSHSDDIALFVFTRDCEIGVDLERIRDIADMQNIADSFFCRDEADDLRSLTRPERNHAFFRCWTRKEAYVKAIGAGLSADFSAFRVTLKPDEPARLLHVSPGQGATQQWTLQDLEPLPGFAAAVAYPDSERTIALFPLTICTDLL